MKDSSIYKKVYGCLIGGLIGDAMGAPVETKHYRNRKEYGQVDDLKAMGQMTQLSSFIMRSHYIQQWLYNS